MKHEALIKYKKSYCDLHEESKLKGYNSFFSTSQNQSGTRTNTTYYNGSNQYCTNCNMKGYNIKAYWEEKK
jgi:hypothetical protein